MVDSVHRPRRQGHRAARTPRPGEEGEPGLDLARQQAHRLEAEPATGFGIQPRGKSLAVILDLDRQRAVGHVAAADADGDRHVLVLQTGDCILYELFNAAPQADGSWQASAGARFDLGSNGLRPDRYTSADAAGLPILPGLVRYDEVVERGEILHALRFTVSSSQSGYIKPATHAASNSSDQDLPPMGLRLRMKMAYDCGELSSEVQVICTTLKRFGMFVADNGGDWFISGATDSRWNDEDLEQLKTVPASAFEVVQSGPIIK